jgi:hypothetical protein
MASSIMHADRVLPSVLDRLTKASGFQESLVLLQGSVGSASDAASARGATKLLYLLKSRTRATAWATESTAVDNKKKTDRPKVSLKKKGIHIPYLVTVAFAHSLCQFRSRRRLVRSLVCLAISVRCLMNSVCSTPSTFESQIFSFFSLSLLVLGIPL